MNQNLPLDQILKPVIDSLEGEMFIKDKELRYMMCNDTFLKNVGAKSPEEVLGKTDLDLESEGYLPKGAGEERYAKSRELLKRR